MMALADFKAIGESASALSGGLGGLGVDELSQTLARASAAVNLIAGTVNIASLAVSLMARENAQDATEAVALAGAMSAVPVVGWERVALATAVTTMVGATAGALLTYKLRGDLSTPSGRTATAQMVGGIV